MLTRSSDRKSKQRKSYVLFDVWKSIASRACPSVYTILSGSVSVVSETLLLAVCRVLLPLVRLLPTQRHQRKSMLKTMRQKDSSFITLRSNGSREQEEYEVLEDASRITSERGVKRGKLEKEGEEEYGVRSGQRKR